MFKTLLLVVLLAPATALADKDLTEPSDGTTWDCATDPTVNISYDKGTFTFTGSCSEINVNGGEVKVTIADVATLNVNGAKNAVKVTELGAVNVNGASNKITWKKAKTGKKPKVATNGRGNSVTRTK